MRSRSTLFYFFLCAGLYGYAQMKDDFSDGDFTTNPTWYGIEANFIINSDQELQLNGSGAGSSYLSTSSNLIDKTLWEFYFEIGFNPSSANYLKVYLISDQEDLSGPLNGYFVKIGDTEDEISLYVQEGATETKLIDGLDKILDKSASAGYVQVIRDESGAWKLTHLLDGVSDPSSEGTATDLSVTNGPYFGVFCDYSSTRADKFFFDDFRIRQLEIDSIRIQSETSLDVYYNQPVATEDAEEILHYAIQGVTIGSVVQVKPNQVRLSLNTPLSTRDYQLTVGSGLTMNEDTSFGFSYQSLELNSLTTLSDHEVLLTFNQELDPESAEAKANYMIDHGIGEPLSAVISESFSVLLELNTPLFEGVDFQLSINGLINRQQNSTLDSTAIFSFMVPMLLDTAYVLSATQFRLDFNRIPDGSTVNEQSNYVLKFGVDTLQPDSVMYQSGDLHVMLYFSNGVPEGSFIIRANNLADEEGNAIDELNNSVLLHYRYLEVLSIRFVGDASLKVIFNQLLESDVATLSSNYVLTEIGNPSWVFYDPSDSSVILDFDQLYNTDVFLTISAIKNELGNAQADERVDSLKVGIRLPTELKSIVVNEIMADPTPSVGLPEAEYVELYNTGDVSIQLEGFLLNDKPLPAYLLPAKSMVLITDNSDKGLFELPNLIALTSFDALTNTGETVRLTDQYFNVVDEVSYEQQWYGDPLKQEGGYALELINPMHPCSDRINWTASNAVEGGTPGLQNSVYSLTSNSEESSIISLLVVGGDSLLISFNEPVDESSLSPAGFELPGYSIVEVIQQDYSSYFLLLDHPLHSERVYTLIVDAVQDCFGDSTTAITYEFFYDISAPLLKQFFILSKDEIALLFHEVLQEWDAEKESNYDLGSSSIYRALVQDTAFYRIHLQLDSSMAPGKNYELTFEGIADTLGNETGRISIGFTYENQIDTVYGLSNNLLQVRYELEPGETASNTLSYLLSDGGQRPIQVVTSGDDPFTYQLAFRENISENKTVKIYVEGVKEGGSNRLLTTPAFEFVLDSRAPVLDSLFIKNDSQIVLTFDESLDVNEATNTLNYLLERSIQPTSAIALNYWQVELTFPESFMDKGSYRLSYSDLKDVIGNTQSATRSFNFVFDRQPPAIHSVFAQNDTIICIVLSEQVEWSTASQGMNYVMDGEFPDSVSILGPDSTTLVLGFEDLVFREANQISIYKIRDKFGNETDTSTYIFDGTEALITSVTPMSDRMLLVDFNTSIDTVRLKTHHVQLDSFGISELSVRNDRSIIVFLSSHLSPGDSLKLSVNDIPTVLGDEFSSEKWFQFQTYFESIQMVDPKTVAVNFSTDFDDFTTDSYKVNEESVLLALPDGAKRSLVRIGLWKELPENKLVSVSWEDLHDKWGRRLPDWDAPVYRDTQPPEVIRVQTDFLSKVILTYSEEVETESSLNPESYQIKGVGIPANVTLNEREVILDFDDHLQSGGSYMLLIQTVSDMQGNTLQDTIAFDYVTPLVPGSGSLLITEIMCDPVPAVGLPEEEYVELFNAGDRDYNLKSAKLRVGNDEIRLPDYELKQGHYIALTKDISAYDPSSKLLWVDLPNLSNAGEKLVVRTIFGTVVDSIIYKRDWYANTEKDDGGFSLELINPFSECPGIVNWNASVSPAGGTPGLQNSIYSLAPDTIPPVALSLELLDDPSIIIRFSEVMDSLSISSAQIITNMSEIELATFQDPRTLRIYFDQHFEEGKQYGLSISGATDCSGNKMKPAAFSFGRGADPEFHELIITEIMSDPEPLVGLPNSEYIELFNTSEKLISLQNVSYSDELETVMLPSISIPPKSYFLLTPGNSFSAFKSENKAALSNWLSLTNAGETLKLEVADRLIFQVTYNQSWHGGDAREGGFSLEMKDVSNPCAGYLNWGTSLSPSGGTPAQPNSIQASVPDRFGPNLIDVFVRDSTIVELIFDEFLYPESNEFAQIHITPEVLIHRISQPEREILRVELSDLLRVNQVYTIEIAGATDCNGNPIRVNQGGFVFADTPDSLNILINEVLFNPRDGGVDFVELYNHSDSYFDLKDWKLGRLRNNQLETAEISNAPRIIGPHEYLALAEDSIILKNQYPLDHRKQVIQLVDFPIFPDEEGTVVLIMPDGRVSDQFTYSEDFHLSLLQEVDGVSLERLSFSGPTQDPNNWSSAAATVGFATPGYSNSQTYDSPQTAATLKIAPKIFVPGTTNAAESSYTTINYQFTQGGKFANVTIFNQLGQPVVELAKGTSLNTSGFLKWDGIDSRGSRVRRGYYVVLFEVYDGSGHQEFLKETVVVGR